MTPLRFIDLFAGLGGFHLALRTIAECVFACEIDDELREIYVENFPDMAGKTFGDIRTSKKLIPPHDILCAGFPCQPFSKSGDQLGTRDRTRGTLFHEILDILKRHSPRYLILENVGNFERHDGGNTWRIVKRSLLDLGYDVRGTEHVTPLPRRDWRDRSTYPIRQTPGRLGISGQSGGGRGHGLISPHHLGFPQTRERFFIVGSREALPKSPFPHVDRTRTTSLATIAQSQQELTQKDMHEVALSTQQVRCIEHWNTLLHALPASVRLPSFPIWGDEIGARYPYAEETPWATPLKELRQLVPNCPPRDRTTRPELLARLPSYARERVSLFRPWKIQYIRQNRQWFASIKKHIPRGWVDALRQFPPSLRKLEWNAKGGDRDLWLYVLQFRPSGLRVKRYTTSPALVAMTTTQIPILGPHARYLTRVEALRLQGFPDGHALPRSRAAAFGALGNAVHVGVAKDIAHRLLFPTTATPLQSEFALDSDNSVGALATAEVI